MSVVVDRTEGEYFVGRSEFCSPEVDPEVLIPLKYQLKIGNMYNVRIYDADEFDLYGEIVE